MASSATSKTLSIDGEECLTVDQISQRLTLSRNTVLAHIYDGHFPAKLLARGAWHVRTADLAAWLARPDNIRQR